jgi:hypothetical protein
MVDCYYECVSGYSSITQDILVGLLLSATIFLLSFFAANKSFPLTTQYPAAD